MFDSLVALEDERRALVQKFFELGDFRPGSISTPRGCCGNSGCHCHRHGASGHGPNFRLTYKVEGKTVTKTFPNLVAHRKAEREVAEFRRYQRVSRAFVAVNEKICRQQPVGEEREATLRKDLRA